MQEIPIILVKPEEIDLNTFLIQKEDIVLDLPKPKTSVFFWCDHHETQRPTSPLPKNYHWNPTPSCAGFLIEIAIKNGLKPTKELLEFKTASEKIDSANYTKEEMKECFYPQPKQTLLSPLLKLEMIASLFQTKDESLNKQIIKTILSQKLDSTPIHSKTIQKLNPSLFHTARLESLELWRKQVDTYIVYDPESSCVIQDDRKTIQTQGSVDRYYSSMKYPLCSYTLHIKIVNDKTARIGLGSNIFHKDRCKINLGSFCKKLGHQFGEGSGGGHKTVAGATIKPENADQAIHIILDELKRSL